MPRFILYWLVAGAMEFPFIEACFFKKAEFLNDHPFSSVLLHLGGAVLLFFSISKEKGWFSPVRLWARNFFFLTATLPFFGWLFSGFLFFLYKRGTVPETLEEEETEPVFVSSEIRWAVPVQRISKKTRIIQELDFMPLADILAGEDLDMKRGAIEKLAELKTPQTIKMLLLHRSDASLDVRFYVTAALTRIKKEFDEQLEAAKQQIKKDVYKVSARIFLAKTYLQYAHSHLLDPVAAETFEQEALYHLDFCLKSGEANKQVYEMLLEIYVSQYQWEKALKIIQKIRESGVFKSAEVDKLQVEILYKTQKYPEMVALLRKMKQPGIAGREFNAIADWWGA